ncbi:hypothetical protein OsI_30295 [Oryza sativa Indica Group]|uniref:Uncharacterized protein n=1 Tax=Oryza sativa subsp. indica TaxID=39946 RepID=A2YY69_ORYSI|nr:hypothetical protein OsI_30295 [Oryza sativa Indica Group]
MKIPTAPCAPALESTDHILLRCNNANNLRENLNLLQLANKSESSSAFLQAVIDMNHSSEGIKPIWFVTCAYTLWKSRNNMVFEGQFDNPQCITQQISDTLKLWSLRTNEANRQRNSHMVCEDFLEKPHVYPLVNPPL